MVLLVSCATAKKMNKLRIGQTREEVEQLLGEPDSSSASNNNVVYPCSRKTSSIHVEDVRLRS